MHEDGLAGFTLGRHEPNRIVEESHVVMIGSEWFCIHAAERHDDIGVGDSGPGDIADDHALVGPVTVRGNCGMVGAG